MEIEKSRKACPACTQPGGVQLASNGDRREPLIISMCKYCWLAYLENRFGAKPVRTLVTTSVEEEIVRFSDVRTLLPRWKKKKVLDIGSQDGSILFMYEKRGYECTGIEADKNLVDICISNGLRVHHKEWNIGIDMPERYDIITSIGSLESSNDPRGFLIKCRQYLRKCGRLYIHLPNHNLISEWRWSPRGIDTRYQFTTLSLGSLCQRVGLRITNVRYHGSPLGNVTFEISADSRKHCKEYSLLLIQEYEYGMYNVQMINQAIRSST